MRCVCDQTGGTHEVHQDKKNRFLLPVMFTGQANVSVRLNVTALSIRTNTLF